MIGETAEREKRAERDGGRNKTRKESKKWNEEFVMEEKYVEGSIGGGTGERET